MPLGRPLKTPRGKHHPHRLAEPPPLQKPAESRYTCQTMDVPIGNCAALSDHAGHALDAIQQSGNQGST
eukprot:10640923-Lingulodinium_polyedra.AAC.1